MAKVSGPRLDRIDVHVEVMAVPFDEMSRREQGEPSSSVRERVEAARAIQQERYMSNPGVHCNAQMTPALVHRYCELEGTGRDLLKLAVQKLGLSARAHDRILKVSRTIADLAGEERVGPAHVSEAVQYRALDRNWGGS